MAVFRIDKTRDYTVMANHHLRNKALSLKAKGLLSLMLSLPEDWDYTTKGLSMICKDGVDSISLFSMRKLYHKSERKASVFNGFQSLFSAQTALNPVTGRWAFGCSICSPSMSQRYCCGVSVFTSDSERGH